MISLYLFILPDCNVSKLFEERLHKALALPEFGGNFNLYRYNMYNQYDREKGKPFGVTDAPAAVINGSVISGVQSDYTIRKWLRQFVDSKTVSKHIR